MARQVLSGVVPVTRVQRFVSSIVNELQQYKDEWIAGEAVLTNNYFQSVFRINGAEITIKMKQAV